jgi:hypothetical protein
LKPDRDHSQVKALAASLPTNAWETVTYRDQAGQPVRSRFAFVHVIAARPATEGDAPREEWLIIEWPQAHEEPSDYWLSNLPADTEHDRPVGAITLDDRTRAANSRASSDWTTTKVAATSAVIITARS